MQIQQPDATSPLAAWLCYLENLHNKTIELGLERVRSVGQKLDLLHPAPYVFTVGGTNGKGTTCRTLEMILLEAGFRVGVYSSPHIARYPERVRVQNLELTEQQHVDSLNYIEQARGDTSLTYFEFGTLSAFHLFKLANLDVVILEVGLGGRLDATNIVDSDVAVITSIAIDHTDWLGSDRNVIGYEKAGIFRAHCPAIVGEPDAPASIIDYASQLQSQLHLRAPNPGFDWSYEEKSQSWDFKAASLRYQDLPLPNVPLANAATALAALSYSTLQLPESAIRAGLEKATLAGRFQIVAGEPLLILDVAHNPHAASYLADRIKRHGLNNKRVHIVLGMLFDKDIGGTIEYLKQVGDKWYCANLYGPRGAKASDLLAFLPEAQGFEHVTDAWQCAMQQADKQDIVVVCGSFHTVADVLIALEDKGVKCQIGLSTD